MNDLIAASSISDEFAKRREQASDDQLYQKLYPEYASLAALDQRGDLFDVLILDEAQDVMSDDALDVFDANIIGGLQSGRWRVFCDINNQGAIYGHFEHKAFERLQRFGHSTLLATNRRNTQQIADETSMLSTPAIASVGVVAGTPVEYAWYDGPAAQAKSLQGMLQRLTKQGILPSQITVLSPRQFESSCAASLKEPALTPITIENVPALVAGQMKGITWSTISSFKGLENDVIILTDIDSLDSEWWRSVVYVGMSRARGGLCMLLNSALKITYESRLRDWIRLHN